MINLSVTLKPYGQNSVAVNAVQGESGSRSLTVTFLDSDGSPLNLTGSSPRMYVAGTNPPVFTDGTILDAASGTARFVLTSNMTAKHGMFFCQFLLSGSEYPALKFTGLTLRVAASDLENAIEATNEFSALAAALGKTEDAAAQAESAAADAKQSSASAGNAAAAAASAKGEADAAAAQVKNVPKISTDGYWCLYSPSTGQYEKSDTSALLIPKGTWTAGNAYRKNEYVYYPSGNAAYCSLTDGNTGTPADDGINWMLLCKGNASGNSFTDTYKAMVDAAVPNTRRIAGLALSEDISLARLTAAGLSSGDGSGNAQNALKLGGAGASNFPQISSGTWTPYLYGSTTAGSPTYVTQVGRYIKIGALVNLFFYVAISAKGGMAGIISVGGLPFPSAFPSATSDFSCSALSKSSITGYLSGAQIGLSLADTDINDSYGMWAAHAVYMTT